MKLHEKTIVNKIGKTLAKPLSNIFANSRMQRFTHLADGYLNILLGKGAGSGWALDAELKAAKSTIHSSSPLLFDVGANKGEWSVLFNQLYPQAQIFMFEPQPGCQKVISEKNIPGSTLIPKAVSAVSGQTIELISSGKTSPTASLYQRRDSFFTDRKNRKYTSIAVETISIDSIIEDHKIKVVDFMKMDVEGHELEVLKGAIKSLEGGIIKAFSFEFGSGNINSRTFFHDFWDLLTPLGYNIYRILPSSRLMRIKEYYEDCEYFRGVTNYIAILSN